MVELALEAATMLEEQGISTAVINARWIKPLDATTIEFFARGCEVVCTMEDHVLHNGFRMRGDGTPRGTKESPLRLSASAGPTNLSSTAACRSSAKARPHRRGRGGEDSLGLQRPRVARPRPRQYGR